MTKTNDDSSHIENDHKLTNGDQSRPISQIESCDEFDLNPKRFASIVSLNDESPPVRIGKWFAFHSIIYTNVE